MKSSARRSTTRRRRRSGSVSSTRTRSSSTGGVTVLACGGAPTLLLAIVFAAGCGGGGSSERLTRDEYAKQADAICSKYNDQTKALANPTSLSELANVADKTLPILDHAISDLRKLRPPENEQSTADAWLAQIENLK